MELHPILEKDTCPNPNLWYVLSSLGESPSARVGHTCTFIPSQDGGNGNLYVIGGANPDGSFSETFVLSLDTFLWDTVDATGLRQRYEHAAFVAESQPDKIYIFGGADQTGNHNDMQVFDTKAQTWCTVTPNGTPPSPRTFHTSACVGDRFIVYSGGQSGSDPVGDRQVHCFDVPSTTWSILKVKGDPPKPRHGHVMVSVGNKLYIYGGMSGNTFYDDLHILDVTSNAWSSVKQRKVFPSARAAHGAVAHGKDVYVFGGMGRQGALDDLYKLNTETNKWACVELEGPPPACRLDFGLCVMQLTPDGSHSSTTDSIVSSTHQAKEVLEQQLRLNSAGSGRSADSVPTTEESKAAEESTSPEAQSTQLEQGDILPNIQGATATPLTNPAVSSGHKVDMLYILGGMDTEGEIFDDSLVFRL